MERENSSAQNEPTITNLVLQLTAHMVKLTLGWELQVEKERTLSHAQSLLHTWAQVDEEKDHAIHEPRRSWLRLTLRGCCPSLPAVLRGTSRCVPIGPAYAHEWQSIWNFSSTWKSEMPSVGNAKPLQYGTHLLQGWNRDPNDSTKCKKRGGQEECEHVATAVGIWYRCWDSHAFLIRLQARRQQHNCWFSSLVSTQGLSHVQLQVSKARVLMFFSVMLVCIKKYHVNMNKRKHLKIPTGHWVAESPRRRSCYRCQLWWREGDA